uniref:Coiled-coil domain containing 92Ba n=1 Tax=Amphilophus citrinellus TaxID=61819 RepID=A0A3Q0QZZ2_AMPCI
MHRFAFVRTHPDSSSSSSSTNQTASHAAEKHFNAPDKMSLGECRSLQDLDRRWRPVSMGDETSLSQQIESVERSMVFLRKEHLTMLHGLHLEILSLQKRCTGQLRQKEKLQEEEELLEAHCLEVENRLAEKECALGELRKELTQKGALVGALRANLKQKERHFLEELKRRSHCSTILNTELQKQTEAAAYLSFQLHAARQKLHQQRIARASSRVERARECVPIEKVMGPAEPTAMPDPALFLHPRRHRARSRHTVAQRQPPLGLEKEEEEEVEASGGEGPVEPQDEAARLVSSAAAAAAAAPPAAETKAD